MKKNKIISIIAAISATIMFTACGETAQHTDATHTDNTIATEPMATTIPATETLKDFEFGQEVWGVCYSTNGNSASLVRYAVVGQQGELVEVVYYFTSDVQQLKESMGCPFLVEMSQVYIDRYEAMVVVAEANGETFEEYWGEYHE